MNSLWAGEDEKYRTLQCKLLQASFAEPCVHTRQGPKAENGLNVEEMLVERMTFGGFEVFDFSIASNLHKSFWQWHVGRGCCLWGRHLDSCIPEIRA